MDIPNLNNSLPALNSQVNPRKRIRQEEKLSLSKKIALENRAYTACRQAFLERASILQEKLTYNNEDLLIKSKYDAREERAKQAHIEATNAHVKALNDLKASKISYNILKNN